MDHMVRGFRCQIGNSIPGIEYHCMQGTMRAQRKPDVVIRETDTTTYR